MMKPTVFFDGHCNLCNGLVNIVISRASISPMYVASLQGKTAQEFLKPEDIASLESVLYLDTDGRVYRKSTAVFKIFRRLGGPYRWLSYLGLLPKSLTDYGYSLIARNRYNLFGRRSTCRLPRPDEQKFFLD